MKQLINSRQKWIKLWMAVFIVIASILFAFGFIHILELDRSQALQKQDLEIHDFDLFNRSLTIIAEAYLQPEYNLLYSFDKTPITLNLKFQDCKDCSELENGITFWYFYEKIEGSGSGGSIVSSSPDNFYRINIKPGEEKIIHGWVQFTGEGIYRHVLWNSTNTIRLESEEKTFTVYANHIANQIRNSIVIESFSAISVGVSFIMLAFISFQINSNIKNRNERQEELKKILSKLEGIKTPLTDGIVDSKIKLKKSSMSPEILDLSAWIQFLGIKASLRTNQYMGIASIFVVGLIGVLSIYYAINDHLTTIIGTSGLIFLYYMFIKNFIKKTSSESQKAEDLLDDIMNGGTDGIDKIKERWFSSEDN